MTFFAEDPPPACHGTNEPVVTVPIVCARFPRTPDRDDVAVEWCTGCGAPLGRPSGVHSTMDSAEPFGHAMPAGFVARTWGKVA